MTALPAWLKLVVEGSEWIFLLYFICMNAGYIALNLLSIISLKRYMPNKSLDDLPQVYSGLEIPVSILVPAYNEEATITPAIHSMLQLSYSNFEILIINDGSRDRTLEVLKQDFSLLPFPEAYRSSLETKSVRGVYRSTTYPNVRVIDKENGGKADSLNAGINASRYPLFCAVDADTILQRDSLQQIVYPFLEDHRVVAAGGTIRVANGCEVSGGFITKVGLPTNLLALFQVVEYLRAFLFGRLGWSAIGGLLIISGAFGLFRKEVVIEVGGFRVGTIGEDMELVMRIHRILRQKKQPYRMVFLPDPVAWTEAPEDLRTLKNQRVRWQRGLAESLSANIGLLCSRNGGVPGWLAFPFMTLFEWLGPLLEVTGYVLMSIFFWAGLISAESFWVFTFATIGLGLMLSVSSLMLEEMSFHIYNRPRHLVLLLLAVILENFGYRQLNSIWRIMGLFQWLIGSKSQWGEMKRVAAGKQLPEAEILPARENPRKTEFKAGPWSRRGLVLAVLAALLVYALVKTDSGSILEFQGVNGPPGRSVVQAPQPAHWQDYQQGGNGRLAILLTDPESSWLGLVHGLHSMGVPFCITTDYREAMRHRVILVYPTISRRVLAAEELQALEQFPAAGGTLIGINVEDGAMNEVFGFSAAQPARTRHEIRFDAEQGLARAFSDPLERVIPFSDPKSGANAAGSFGYAGAQSPLARFDDGTAAITARRIGDGHAYAFGVDLGFLLLTGYNNREQGVARSYVNAYEPALDVLLRLLQDMYREGEPAAVTLGTVPQGKALTTLITHDIDYSYALANAVQYAEFEAKADVHASYFIQTKYVRDWNDDAFFNDAGLVPLRRLRELGMEVASHSVSHSREFNHFPLGTGEEHYPQYHPFVRDQTHTDNGTVLGELRVSRFLLEHFLPGYQISSFRPGHLRDPYTLPQALEASGYRFSSSATANNSLTHLPFRLTYGRETTASSNIFEFPVSIEDEALPPLGDRLPQALQLADRLARYGGLMNVLIHPDIIGHKFKFEQGLVAALQQRAWFGTMREFGEFWAARDKVTVDVERQGKLVHLVLSAPEPLTGLTLILPSGYRVASIQPGELAFTQSTGHVVIKQLKGDATLTLEDSGAAR